VPRREEVIASVAGALRLARFDARGMQYFDISLGGFWRSFFAALLVVPFSLYWLVTNYPETEAGPAWVLFIEAVFYAIDWISFPLLMIPIARSLGLSRQYIPFIIAGNWSTVVTSALFFALAVVVQTNVVPLQILEVVGLAAIAYLFMYLVFVARTALGVSIVLAILLALIDFALGYLVRAEFERFF
jgi:hypothetical protein